MILKGTITKINEDKTVNINIDDLAYGRAEGFPVLNCTIAMDPGTINAYKEKDMVYIGLLFERIDRAVILGKCYTDTDDTDLRGAKLLSSLEVGQRATLPADTTIKKINTAANTVEKINILDRLLPPCPSNESDKVYVLKCINGNYTWIEESIS